MVCCAHSAAQPQPYALPLTLNPRAHSALRHRQAAAVDMEEEFLNLGLDIIGLGVFNFVNAWCAPGAVLGASPMAWAPRAEACGGAQVADAAAADDGRPQGPGRAAEVPALRGHAGTAQSAAAALLRMRAPAADAPRARSS